MVLTRAFAFTAGRGLQISGTVEAWAEAGRLCRGEARMIAMRSSS